MICKPMCYDSLCSKAMSYISELCAIKELEHLQKKIHYE